MMVFSGAARRRGYLSDHVHLGVGLHWLRCQCSSSLWKILQLSPQTAWAGAGYPLPFLQRRFYLRYRSGHWKTLTVVGERQTVKCGNKKKRISIFAAIGTAGPPLSQFPPSILRRPDAASPGAPVMPARAGAVADHEDVAAHPGDGRGEDGLVGVHLDLRIA